MPNWTYNKIVCKKSIGDRILENSKDGYSFDFNKLIPMPENLKLTAGGLEKESVASYYLSLNRREQIDVEIILYEKGYWSEYKSAIIEMENNIKALSELENDYKEYNYNNDFKRFDTVQDLGKQYIENIKNYNHPNWYEWCCANWGTKWNVGKNVDVEFDEINNEYTICFKTAWSVPIGIVKEFSKFCENGELHWDYYDEDYDGNHSFTKEQNKILHDVFYEEKENDDLEY